MECTCCKKVKPLNFGMCFQCAEAESILVEGLDMQDKGPSGTEEPAKTHFEKLQFLIKKGWRID